MGFSSTRNGSRPLELSHLKADNKNWNVNVRVKNPGVVLMTWPLVFVDHSLKTICRLLLVHGHR